MGSLLPLVLLIHTPAEAVEVNVRRVLTVDVSCSVAPGELEIQRVGHAGMLRLHTVMAAIEAVTGETASRCGTDGPERSWTRIAMQF